MTKDTLIKRTLSSLSKLPQDMVREVSDYTDAILKKIEEEIMTKGVQELDTNS